MSDPALPPLVREAFASASDGGFTQSCSRLSHSHLVTTEVLASETEAVVVGVRR